ncbi:MAG: helix-turn-helix transcriptional regulator [Tenuifilaceae bacterium]|nr:helix-turn-helix transcriptional regulator [Tenuifilaceae bacterium]
MKERLQRILTKEGIAPTRFAEIIGVQRSSISHILSGRNKPSFDMIQSIMSKFPKLNPDWLILGTGDMYRKVVQTALFADPDTSKETSSPSTSPQHNIDTRKEQQVKPSENSIFEKRVERVIVFYNDKTFTEYSPQ